LVQQEGRTLVSTAGKRQALSITIVAIGLATVLSGARATEGAASGGALDTPIEAGRTTEGPQDRRLPASKERDASRSPGVELPQEAELRQRVQARWNAVVNGNFREAYAFETPDYRKAHSEQSYRDEFGRQVRWHVATLRELRYDRADEVEAVITLDYSFALPGGDQMARTTSDVTEHWVYSDGHWWRRHDRSTLGDNPRFQPSPPQ